MKKPLKLLLTVGLITLTAAAQNGTFHMERPEVRDEFVPKDVRNAVAMGCMVSGMRDNPPYAETQIFVKYVGPLKGWDYKPIMARRTTDQGGILKAIEDCREWLAQVEKAILKAGQQADPPVNKDRNLGLPAR